jgi:hypothetical protein
MLLIIGIKLGKVKTTLTLATLPAISITLALAIVMLSLTAILKSAPKVIVAMVFVAAGNTGWTEVANQTGTAISIAGVSLVTGDDKKIKFKVIKGTGDTAEYGVIATQDYTLDTTVLTPVRPSTR